MNNTPGKPQVGAGYPATPQPAQAKIQAQPLYPIIEVLSKSHMPGMLYTHPSTQATTQAGQIGVANAHPGVSVPGALGIPGMMIPEETEVITRKKLQELVGQISPGEVLDPEVEEVLLEVVDDFIDSVTTFACSLAKHRGSSTLEVRDLMTHLERNWNIKIPGYSTTETARPFNKRPIGSDGHKTRLALVRKSLAPPSKQQKL